ncbi:hypothetical protein EA472_05660 [Natrarchaeobius oligotrophus]|uniref:DUF8106 domain-containing protein n=1 Tax=Natrarchaeobius chitinivorans TaxID=1679083 RepID=A0A3N6MKB2_NATCH|nr:hypothetical protein EA472_05660 [Natrarchaeobius chitinivorans]
MNPSTQPVDQPPPRKTTLYCFNCGHESTVDGDWEIRKYGRCADYDCPECKTTITTRPRTSDTLTAGNGVSCYCSGD